MKFKERRPRRRDPIKTSEVLSHQEPPSEIFRLGEYIKPDELQLALESLHDFEIGGLVKDYFTCLLLGDEVINQLPLEQSWPVVYKELKKQEKLSSREPYAIVEWLSIAAQAIYVYWQKRNQIVNQKLLDQTWDYAKGCETSIKESVVLLRPDKKNDLQFDWDTILANEKSIVDSRQDPSTNQFMEHLIIIALFFPEQRHLLKGCIPVLKKMAQQKSDVIQSPASLQKRKQASRLLLGITAALRICMADSVVIDQEGKIVIHAEAAPMTSAAPLPPRNLI